jgi:threonine/homoserine/homoserine lactone efflux protein
MIGSIIATVLLICILAVIIHGCASHAPVATAVGAAVITYYAFKKDSNAE